MRLGKEPCGTARAEGVVVGRVPWEAGLVDSDGCVALGAGFAETLGAWVLVTAEDPYQKCLLWPLDTGHVGDLP